MALAPGTRLGPYEVTAQIGAGGMGEVYRATDTSLKRQVAIKVLPDAVATDPERLARFQREAEVLAALNHPNIAHIYGLERSDGQVALVMELVEGPTLADRIAQAPIGVDEALRIAKQIADALEAAHEQGIIHRDLKPANVKLREDGTVKVLDFGLAKAIEPAVASGSSSVSMSPTITTPAMTEMGMILGTAAYMAPEQAKGRAVDKRADIWAFGAVLYEMLSGVRAFEGDDVSDTMAAVLRAEVRFDALPDETPARVRQVLTACLERDPRQRVHDIADVRLALDGAFETVVRQESAAPPPARPVWQQWWLWAALATTLVLAVVVLSRTPAALSRQPLRRFADVLPPDVTLPVSSGTLVGISPDGETVVYRVQDAGTWRLFRRDSNEFTARPVPGTEDAGSEPFFSPDGQWLGFTVNGVLWKALLAGGRPVEIGEVGTGLRGIEWLPDGSFILGARQGLTRVSEAGDVVSLTASDDGRQYWYPQLLPDGRHVLFTASEPEPDTADLLVLDLETGSKTTLLPRAAAGRYTAAGHLTFVRGGDLWAVRFDPTRLEVQGDPRLVEQGIRVEGGGAVQVAVADDGTVVYLPGDVSEESGRTLVWVDRQAHEEPVDVTPDLYSYPRLSADGARVALATSTDPGDVFVWDFARRVRTNVTASEAVDFYALWGPDDRRLIFSSDRDGPRRLYWQAADGTGTPEALTAGGDSAVLHYPHSVTADGVWLVYREQQGGLGTTDLRMVSLEGDHETRDLLSTEFVEFNAELSPNGRWMAYESDRAGHRDIYVSPFPDATAGRETISPAGGTRPAWAPNGRELFYVSLDGNLMSVAVDPDGDEFQFESATPILDVSRYFFQNSISGRNYDFDGDRFLFLQRVAAEADDGGREEVRVVRNWVNNMEQQFSGD